MREDNVFPYIKNVYVWNDKLLFFAPIFCILFPFC